MSAIAIGLAVLAIFIFGVVDFGDLGLSDASPILFVETFQFDAQGIDEANLNGEFVTLQNQGEETVDLSGWLLRNDAAKTFAFPEGFVLTPGATVVVRSGCGEDTETDLHWCSPQPIWDNVRGSATLFTQDGKWVTGVSYEENCTACGIKTPPP